MLYVSCYATSRIDCCANHTGRLDRHSRSTRPGFPCSCFHGDGLMRAHALLFALALSAPCALAQAGFLGHVAAYATGAIAAHEAERAIDGADRSRKAGRGDFEPDGAYGVVFPLSATYPIRTITPGAINPRVTQANIHQTICVPGYSKMVRPPESYTEPLKRELIAKYGFSDRRLRDYELDHLISIELGGSPSDPRNLFPQPHHVIGGWGSYAKDKLENRLHSLVCRGQIPLAEAQHDIAHDWVAAYKKYIGATPDQPRSYRYGG